MAILSDFFVATPEHALRYAASFADPEEDEEIRAIAEPREFKGFTGLEFGALWAILAEEEWDPLRHSLEHIDPGEENDSWLQRFPYELTDLLARMDEERRQSAAAAWSGTEDIAFEAADLEVVLGDLRELASTIRRPHTAMYLWGALRGLIGSPDASFLPLQTTRPQMTTSTPSPRTGGCLCGQVRYKLTADPVIARLCWCRDCQHIAGNGTANAIFPATAIEVSGDTAAYVSAGDSGNAVTRRFCARCGCHLFADSTGRPGLTVVRIGTLDAPSSVTPTANIWSASAPAWACLDGSLERVERQPLPGPAGDRPAAKP